MNTQNNSRAQHEPFVGLDPSDGLWDKKQTARFCGVSPATVDRWVCDKTGPTYLKVGALVRFHPRDIHEFLNRCRNGRGGNLAA